MSLLRRRKAARDEIVDLTDHDGVRAVDDAEVAASDRLVAGVPGRCPTPVCDGFGFVDHIDMRNRFQVQHCRACGHSWQYTFDEDGVVIDLLDDAGSSIDS